MSNILQKLFLFKKTKKYIGKLKSHRRFKKFFPLQRNLIDLAVTNLMTLSERT
jgi:hypothetical protein